MVKFARAKLTALCGLATACCLPAVCGPVVGASMPQAGDARELAPQDYMAIQQLVAGYAYKLENCSNGGYDYADQYATEGTFGVSTAWGSGKVWYRGRDQLADAGGGGKDGCRFRSGTAPGKGKIHYVVTNIVITATKARVTGRSTLLLLGTGDGATPPSAEWIGGYEDTYVKTGVGWRFQSRFHVWPDHVWPELPPMLRKQPANGNP